MIVWGDRRLSTLQRSISHLLMIPSIGDPFVEIPTAGSNVGATPAERTRTLLAGSQRGSCADRHLPGESALGHHRPRRRDRVRSHAHGEPPGRLNAKNPGGYPGFEICWKPLPSRSWIRASSRCRHPRKPGLNCHRSWSAKQPPRASSGRYPRGSPRAKAPLSRLGRPCRRIP